MSPIKDFKLRYEALNKENTFAAGDTINGTVTFTLTDETKVKSLYVKAKGDANVHWSEGTGDRRRSHTAHKRFFKTKEFLIAENTEGTILSKGDHCYQFKLKIPDGNIPPSFKSYCGRIVHVLQAKMSRSWHPSSSERKELNFVSRSFLPFDQAPQAGSVDKEIGTFSKGQVHMSATVNKRVCSPGETLMVTVKITNKSSKKMRIKFSIEQKTVYRARFSAKIQHGSVCKIAGETINPDFEGNITCPVTVPPDTSFSILNCEIINVEFYLKAYLDISFAADPEVVFPLIIAYQGLSAQHGQNSVPCPAGAIGGPSSSDFPAPIPGPYPVPPGPPHGYPYPPHGYAYPPPGPVYPSIPSGYNNQMPQQPTPYGFPPAPFMSYPAPPQANTMNPQFPQEQAPPSYMSLFPPPQNETEKKTEL